MENKTLDFEIKELSEEGRFSGYLSTFGNVDYGGDVVDPGAFKKTLRENKTFPLAWQHQFGSPDFIVGSFEAKEDGRGLFINGGFFTDQDGGIKAYKLVKKFFAVGIKVGLSMGYKTIKDALEEIEGGFLRHLKEVKLREGSITLFPMDKQAAMIQVKEEADENLETKPSKDNHICRINNGEYSAYRSEKRNHNGKPYTIRFGRRKKDGKMEEYEYFYPAEKWSASEAGTHCKEHDGSFEPALKKDEEPIYSACRKALEPREPDRLERILKDLKESTPKEKPPESTGVEKLTKILMEV